MGGNVNLSEVLEDLTGSHTVQDFMDTPLENFITRVLGGNKRERRALETIGDFVGRSAAAATPVLSILDYENAFTAVQVTYW